MKLISLIIASALLTACATIFSGTTDEISFSSNVDPVKVYVDGINVGTTPLKVDVEKKAGKGRLVRFEKSGYKSQEFNLKNRFDSVAVLDITLIPTSGGIDVLTGAIMEYDPKQYHVEMVRGSHADAGDNSQQIQFASFVLSNAESIKADLASGEGEALDTLFLLVDSGSTSFKFQQWLSDNSQSIIAAETPERLLATIRSSGLTL